MKVNRPYHLNTGTLSAFYETLEEATNQFEYWKQFYCDNWGKYGTHEITISKGKKELRSVIILG